MPFSPPGLRAGTQADFTYLSYVWYNLQLILNDSNGHQQDHHPIDWDYSNGIIKDLGALSAPQGGIQTLWMIKGLQVLQEAGTGPQLGIEGWQPAVSQISLLVTTEWNYQVWRGVDPSHARLHRPGPNEVLVVASQPVHAAAILHRRVDDASIPARARGERLRLRFP